MEVYMKEIVCENDIMQSIKEEMKKRICISIRGILIS